MLVKLVINNKSRYFDRLYTYRVPEDSNQLIKEGMRVLIPFGARDKLEIGLICKLNIAEEEKDYEIKNIIAILDKKPFVSKELIELAFFMNNNYVSGVISAFSCVSYDWKNRALNKKYRVKNIDEINESKAVCLKQIIKYWNNIKKKSNSYFKMLLQEEITSTEDKISVIYYNESHTEKILSRSKKQLEVVELLKREGSCNEESLLKELKLSKKTLQSLLDKKIIIRTFENFKDKPIDTTISNALELTKEQNTVYNSIIKNHAKPILLKGVTGSGKTEIYLQLAKYNLDRNMSSIILVPEISLTPQTIERFRSRFGDKIAIIHSRLTKIEKLKQIKRIEKGEARIVVGARSAIFSPVKKLGLIVIDEEHDSSYISSQDPKYHTYNVAQFRRNYHNCMLVMASATPSVIAYKKALDGKYILLELKNRINQHSLPQSTIVNMTEELKSGNYSMLSRLLEQKITEKLNKNEQIILFLNKIGHTSFIFCRNCGHVVKCDACDVSLTYHKSKDRLICHYCGRSKKKGNICPNCGSAKFKEFGAGTEKLEEEVRRKFPTARIMRMDSQTTVNKDQYKKMYQNMKSQSIDILIGTQMISKGLDFSNVTLVGIVAADLSLNTDDYISNEKTYQIITQVSGRSGRGEKNGEVIIQTYKPSHFAILSAVRNDYLSFYNKEMDIRKNFFYPPYVDIIIFRFSGLDRSETQKVAFNFTSKLKNYLSSSTNILLGPSPSKISIINNRFRYNLLLKTKEKKRIIGFLSNFLVKQRLENSKVRIAIDINPFNIN